MTDNEIISYMKTIGWTVDTIVGADNLPCFVIRNYEITSGSLAGHVCDVAVQQTRTIPYIPPHAIHTKPALVRMDMNSSLRTKQSGIGTEWQYWSRVFNKASTPKSFVAHIATIFDEVKI